MPYNGAGVFSPLNPPNFPAVSGQVISATYFNAVINDLIAGLTQAVAKDGQSTIAGLAMQTLTVQTSAALPTNTTVDGVTVLTKRYSTGEVISTISPTAPTGTIALDGKTVGSAASGATGRANADAQALFEMLWDNSTNALLPIQDAAGGASTRGASAAADFGANKRMPLPTPRDGDALLAAVSSTLMALTAGEVLSHSHTASSDVQGYHDHNMRIGTSEGDSNTVTNGSGQNSNLNTDAGGAHSHNITVNATGGTRNKAAGLFLKFYIAL